jgi:hypothetical protein
MKDKLCIDFIFIPRKKPMIAAIRGARNTPDQIWPQPPNVH